MSSSSSTTQEKDKTQSSLSEITTEGKRRAVVEDFQLLQLFFRYLKPHSRWVILGISAIPFSVAATILLPWLIVHIVDEYLVAENKEGFYWMIFWFGSAVVMEYIADSIYTFSLQKSGQLAIFSIRKDLYEHALQLPRSYFDQQPIGVMLTRITSDTEALGESMAVGVLTIITDILKILGLFVLLIYLSWQLTLIVLLVLPPMYVISAFLRKKLRNSYHKTREALAQSTGFLQECLNGIKTVQLYSKEIRVGKRYQNKTFAFLHAQNRSNFYESFLFSMIEAITSIVVGLMIWYGAGKIMLATLSLGVLIGFINTLQRIFVPIRQFTQQLSVIQRALAALSHINQLLQEPTEPLQTLRTSQKEALQSFHSLSFENVWFRYHENDAWVLKGVSFELKKGERIAIVGTTGSGKSTIIRLIMKTYGNYQGSIKINGIELESIPLTQVRKMISLMQQDIYLFDESVSFNISLNRAGIGKIEVENAAKYVYAHSFIEQLPERYAFELQNGGKNLSSGQAQLIAFARAMAGNQEVVIMDEATSSVDSVTENLIQKAIEKILTEKTVIAIAHRLSTIQHSDVIIVMQKGEIVEKGTHQELLHHQGVYASLVKNLH